MTKPMYTHVAILLDKSSSMRTNQQDAGARTGINAMIADFAQQPGKITMQIAQFAENLFYPEAPVDAREFPKLTPENYKADGYATALWKAFDEYIEETGLFLASLPEDERPSKVVFVVQTDGQENHSGRNFNVKSLVDKVKRQTIQYNWQFVFLGADMDAIASGGQMGIAPQMTMSYEGTRQGTTESLRRVSNSVSSYHSSTAKDLSLANDNN